MSRRESVGRKSSRTQSASGPPSQQMVSVAVLPPRMAPGMAPPTGIGAAEAFSWDESLNWQHNEPIKEEEPSKRKGLFRKAGLTTQRKRLNPELPPFVLRQIPYDTWRKHYAKDKDGNYHGTHAPAENCLLKPHDVQKWRLGEPVTKGDQWTRGSEALPVYSEITETHAVPEYEHDYDGPPRTQYPGDPVPDSQTWDDDASAERSTSIATANSADRSGSTVSGKVIANGKTAQEIIAEAQAKGNPKLSWKERAKKAGEYASMGAGH